MSNEKAISDSENSMMSVKRYDPELRTLYYESHEAEMSECADGEYVKWEDYKSLLAKYLALRSTGVCGDTLKYSFDDLNRPL